MGPFEQFKATCGRYRLAGEIVGCLNELLLKFTGSKKKTEVLLRDLRAALIDRTRDREDIPALAEELARESAWRKASSGAPVAWLGCPIKAQGTDCADCVQPGWAKRSVFRDGEFARLDFLEFIDIHQLALHQIEAFRRIRGLLWSKDRVEEMASQICLHPLLEDRCYAKATFDFVEGAIARLSTHGPPNIMRYDIKGVLRAFCPTKDGMTLYGRFGSIILAILEILCRETELSEWDPPGGDAGPPALDKQDCFEVAMSKLEPKDRDVVRHILAEVGAGRPRGKALSETAVALSLPSSRIKSAWNSFVSNFDR